MADITRTIVMNEENWKDCKNISDKMDRIIDGYFKNIDGEAVEVLTDADGYYYLEHDGIFYCEQGHKRYFDDDVEDIDSLDDYTLFEYFADVLDYSYIVNHDKSFRAVRVLVAYGGPNIYIDTFSGKVELYWWSEYAEYTLRSDVIEAINDYFEEIYNCY